MRQTRYGAGQETRQHEATFKLRGGKPFHRMLQHIAVLALVFAGLDTGPVCGQATPDERVRVIDEVWDRVENEFYDPQLHGLDADAIRAEYHQRAREVSELGFPDLVNEMLGRLETSHTAFFSPNDPRHYQLLGVFDFLVPEADDPRLSYDGIGMEVEWRDGRAFVRCVYDGLPAHQAGIQYGDEIVAIDGRPWEGLRSFAGKRDQTVVLQLRRQEDAAPIEVSVPVERLNGRTMFEDALRASVRTFEVDGATIGYMHVWSYAGTRYHDVVRQQLLWGDLKDCDAVILDLRDGWGGAGLDYLNLFREPLARTSSRGRNGETQTYDGVWTRPVVLLVNERSTSGKEMYTYAFKKHGMGEVVGSRTAGAVMAGSPRLLESGNVLYLAVMDVEIDGQRLEGVGVEPTVPVERPLPYAAGADPQLDAALATAVRMTREKPQPSARPQR